MRQRAMPPKVKILNTLKNVFVDNYQKVKQEVVDEISLEQKELLKTSAGFRYMGEYFFHRLEQNCPRYKVKALHESLTASFIDNLEDWKRHEDRQLHVNAFLITVLNTVKNFDDLYRLLPDCLHFALPKRGEGSGETLTDEKVSIFLSTYQKELGELKTQFFINSIRN